MKTCNVIDLSIEIFAKQQESALGKKCLRMEITDAIRFQHESSKKTVRELNFTKRPWNRHIWKKMRL